MKAVKFIFVLLSLVYSFQFVSAQISEGGTPISIIHNIHKSSIPTITIPKPDLNAISLEDAVSEKKAEAFRMGVILAVKVNIDSAGTWSYLNNGDKIWQLRLYAKDALATSLYFDKFYLPKGCRMFIYNDDQSKIIGAFTHKNNQSNGLFSTQLIGGDAVIVEYYEPSYINEKVRLSISDINYAYRAVNFIDNLKYGFGSSGNCEVNVNCSEGDNWKTEKQGVVRINVRAGGSSKWCTGSLVNNTLQDFKPYLLTADHCENGVSASDLSQWVFYFNYEAPSCSNPSNEGNLSSQSLTGAVKIASGGDGGNSGSDFLLLLMNNTVPESYNPYFLGWDRTEAASLSGVCIHHPAGDIKKISTYTNPLVSSYWVNTSIISHWRVQWEASANGHGVTEGGSSGSPIFNINKRIVGTETGGDSYCNNLIGPDYYGKFSWHWDVNGPTPDNHLKEWLDPSGSNVMYLNGKAYAKADFTANKTIAKVGETIDFTDKSVGGPYQYSWKFEGGNPSVSNDQNPAGIRYLSTGTYNVTLNITSVDTTYSLIKSDYIHIWDDVNIFINPLTHKLCIDLKNNDFKQLKIKIYNVLGKEMDSYNFVNTQDKFFSININNYNNGIYLVRLFTEVNTYESKILINN